MDSLLHQNKTFENINYSGKEVVNREFENCTFKNCDLSNSIFTSSKFITCNFLLCNLSMIKLNNTQLDSVTLNDCKVLGVDFSKCSDFAFGVVFSNCVLDYSSFERRKMTKTLFLNSKIKGVDFTEADLSKSKFENCDLEDAVFIKSILRETDFTSAYNFVIDPERNLMKKAKFTLQGLTGLLVKYGISVE